MSIESLDHERRKAIDADEARPSEMVGSSVQRREDPHLISGDAEYTDDIQYPQETHLAILRSQYGHARINGIDTSAAEEIDGVVGVFTQDDVEASGASGTVRTDSPDNGTSPEQPLLARDHVTYQGQAIAGVVAEDRYTAHDAIDAIEVEYERLDAVAKPREAIADDAPTIHEDAPDNVAFEWENGDKEATEAAFEDADHTVEFDLEINKVIPTAMEPRAAVARYRGSTDELTVEMSTQNPHTVQDDLSDVLNIPDNRIRVRPPDVGGGFGAKLQPYTGHLLAAWCSTQLERPVKWVSTRSDDCQSMVHSRYQDITASAALDDAGNILAVKAESLADVGGYIAPGGSGVPQNLGLMLSGQYAIPTGYVEMTGTFTNTTPLAAYRGAGRPEATYFIERLVDVAANELDMDPVEIRKQNFIPKEDFPYETGFEHTYDSGDYANTLDVALDHVDYEAVRERQAELREEDRYLGIGISCYVEACGAAPGWPETGTVQFKPSGNVVLKSGTAEIGTGHRTGYTQIAAAVLGVDYEDIEVIEGDTAMVTEGNGTGGSRAMPVGGSAIRESSVDVREKARKIAAHQLEAAEEDLEFEDGEFAIRGAP
ncbi:MAG: xanthine dehydrogenase family protein molybdopterin-binding subunit, partial [Halobacteriales archaeon]|nr:xanthine dehydrogenase family protein molybdopterin-binding subunit [Halobacteriales archaeon]